MNQTAKKLPSFSMRQLLDAGVHFGHKTMRWNPHMAPYIFGVRNNIHIIDLQQTVPMLHQALGVIHDVAARNGRILFVGTKRQASTPIAEAASRCGQYYVNHRWLGGMMTNWNTVSKSIKTLKDLEAQLEDEDSNFNKKEALQISRKITKLELALGGIKDMGGVPDLIFVIDTNKENIAITEAKKLGIPVVAILDTNSKPEGVTYPIPGNDDALRSIRLYCDLVSEAVLGGIQKVLGDAPVAANTEKPLAKKLPAIAKKNLPAEKLEDKLPAKVVEKELASEEKKPTAKKTTTAKKVAAKKATSTKKEEDKAEDKPKIVTKKSAAKKTTTAKKAEAKKADDTKTEDKKAS